MAFINNKKFSEIRESAKNGNEKAKMILQALTKNSSQQDLDGLINDYYNIVNDVPPIEQIEEQPIVEEVEQQENIVPLEQQPQQPIEDLTSVLDGEMDGLLDENDVEDISFGDFLKNKQRDGMRSKKNADYFKAYDLNGRQSYMNNKINAYKGKFDGRKRDIERQYSDLGQSIDKYSKDVNLMLDDDNELDMNVATQAYDELVGDENAMKAFGRHWDESDNLQIADILKSLVIKYGKKNVMAVLNTLKSDNDNYQNFRNQQIDSEIGRYSKSIENLLK